MIPGLAALRGLFIPRHVHAAAIQAIVELLDGTALAADVEDALAHVEMCAACRHEVADVAPLVLGLRRFGAAVRANALPDAAGWRRLSERLAGAPRRTTLRAVAPALIAPLVVAVALMPAIGVSRSAYVTDLALSETGAAPGSDGVRPLRPAERAVDERANYDVLRWAGPPAADPGGAGSLVGLRIPGLPDPTLTERAPGDVAPAPGSVGGGWTVGSGGSGALGPAGGGASGAIGGVGSTTPAPLPVATADRGNGR